MYAIRLAPPGTVAAPAYALTGSEGDTVYCRFTIDNLGNARDSLAVSNLLPPPADWPVSDVILFFDADGNGRFDPGENDPAFLAFDAGGTITLDVAIAIPTGALGDAFVEIVAVSTNDAAAEDRSVVRVTSTASAQALLHLGPAGNPRALPGGDGSADDVTTGSIGYSDLSYTFENDVLNESALSQLVEVRVPDIAAIAPGVVITVADSSGAGLAQSPSSSRRFRLGAMEAGQTQRFQVVVTSANGQPLCKLAPNELSLDVAVHSLSDTLLQNTTVDRLVPPRQVNAAAAIALRQTFHETVASAGDVVTLVVTVENITDSLRVDDLDVAEFVQPQLSFVSSPDFVWRDGRLSWRAGSLGGGESRTAVAKFVANTRVSEGRAKAIGSVEGNAETGDAVAAGPVMSVIKLRNDVFGVEGVILGDVFVDDNDNDRRDAGEDGVPNIAVYLESGEYAVTDSAGTFSIPRVFAGYRMVRLDESGLPAGITLAPADARRPNERLVHLLKGAHARVSFATRRVPVPEKTVEVEQAVSCQEKVSIQKRARMFRADALPSSYFALGKAELAHGADRALEPVVTFLRENPGWKLFAEGHTDNIPINTEEFPSNYELSLARADAVREHVATRGIDYHRIFIRGYADTRPVASNSTLEGRRHNRRVELLLIPPHVQVGSDGRISQLGELVRDLSELPDTYRATVFWQVATSETTPRNVTFSLQTPEALHATGVVVHAGGEVVTADQDARYFVGGFSRVRPIMCEVEFTCSDEDTARIRELSAVLDLGDEVVTVRPYQGGSSVDSTTWYDLLRWTERQPVASNATSIATQSPEDHAPEFDSAPGAKSKGPVSIVEPFASRVYKSHDRIRVRASLPLGTRSALYVDGVPVPVSRVGQRTINVALGEEQVTWYAVQIQPGWNTIALVSQLINGDVETDTVRVALSARTAALTAVRDRVLVPADGRTRESIAFEVTDGLGLPVADGIVATVVEGEGLVDAVDARPDTRGLQVLVAGGRVTLETRPRNDSGRGAVVVECDGFRARTDVSFVSGQKPHFATGVVDLKLGAFQKRGEGSGEGVEDFHDGVELEADSRLFVQGTMPHGVSVTARLDSRRRYDDPLLKDIDEDRQYPVFGDASSVHYAAPSQGGNYVALERGESFVRYGDFRTPLEDGEFLSYRRAATGVTSALVRGASSFESFVTKTDFSTHQDEVPADGTSGFYYLTRAPLVEHSEQIFLETRDRYQREKVLDVRPMVRNRDYTINYFDGSLLFKEPVPSVDRDFNPVVIVAAYEVETEDDAQYLFGARGDYAEGTRYRAGSTVVARRGEGQNYALYGVDAELHFEGLRVAGEVAQSDDDATGKGNAFKIEAGYSGGVHDHEVYLRRVDGDFTNPSFRGASHELSSLKTGFRSGVKLGGNMGFEADGFVHRLDRTGEQKENLRTVATYDHPALRFVGGARFARHEQPSDDVSAALSILGVAVGGDGSNGAGASTVWEKNLTGESVEDYPDRLKTQAGLPLGERYKLLAGHEYLTAAGRAGSHQATAGVESRFGEATTAYTKYAMNRTANDERMGAVTGLKHRVRVREGVAGTLGAEAYRSLSERPDDEYVTLKSGLDARVPGRYLVEGQYEYRWQTRRTKHLVRLNAARQLHSGLAAVLKSVVSVAPDDVANDELGVHSNLAVAHRPLGDAVHSLWMLRNDYERYTPVNPEAITWRLVFSTDVNLMPDTEHELRFKYAFKHVENYSFGASHTANADLILTQYVYRFARGWDLDLWGRLVRQRDDGSLEAGSGLEVGRTFMRALRVGAGYSINGFEDPDFAGTDAWASGLGVRVQLLLSDWILDELGVTE